MTTATALSNRLEALRAKRLKGATLLETLLVLTLIALVLVAGLVLYNIGNQSNKVNQFQTQLQAYVGGVKALYETQSTYANVSSAILIAGGKAPANAVVNGGTALRNPWGGDVTIGNGTATQFDVTFAGVPDSACVAALSLGLLDDSSIIAVKANGKNFAVNPTPAEATQECDAGKNNALVFTAR